MPTIKLVEPVRGRWNGRCPVLSPCPPMHRAPHAATFGDGALDQFPKTHISLGYARYASSILLKQPRRKLHRLILRKNQLFPRIVERIIAMRVSSAENI